MAFKSDFAKILRYLFMCYDFQLPLQKLFYLQHIVLSIFHISR